ncbi:hypothetical protein LTR85_002138 [Meristemomyces frigidus]|nr:hypothetical protein LTR85_002138 [Meristemomyces frigidus]
MTTFRAPVNQANRHKTKGNWTIARLKDRALAGQTSGKRCRFFELPAELRNRIYEFVFAPSTTIALRNRPAKGGPNKRKGMPKKPKEPLKPHMTLPVLWSAREMGKMNNSERANTKWRTSISGIILASKQTYLEAIPYVYEQTVFHFAVSKLARTFLKTVREPNRNSIRKLQLHHCTWGHGSTLDARLAKDKAEAGFARLCQSFATALPNLISLDVAVRIYEHPDRIVPAYSDPADTITIRQIQRLSWVQALQVFAKFSKLTDVNVELLGMPQDALEYWFLCDPSYRDVTPSDHRYQICAKWTGFRRSLYSSLGEAVRRLIMGFEGDVVWEEHMAKLEEYRAFCWDKLTPTTETMGDPRYLAFVAKHVKRQS